MATIKAFPALRYNLEKTKEISSLVTPPYDVISKHQQSQFYRQGAHNLIRIILGQDKKGDNQQNNKYTRAAAYLDKWTKEAILIRDKAPAIYIYQQLFDFEGKKLSRLGFIGLLKLEPSGKGVVFPHEKTFCKPKEDRLSLLKSTRANLSPIFGLYSDSDSKIENLIKSRCLNKPLMDFEFEQVRNRLWPVNDPDFIISLEKLTRNKKIFIADGHHRYEVACLYDKLTGKSQKADKPRRAAEPRQLNSAYIMMYFSALESRGLKVLPTHRVINNLPNVKLCSLKQALAKHFIIEHFTNYADLSQKLKSAKITEHFFGLYLGNKIFYLLKLRKITNKNAKHPAGSYKDLDVVILHNLIFKRILGIKEENSGDQQILYTREEGVALNLVDSKKYQAAFFMNPPKPIQISAISESLKKMPHKSTYFYPKPLSGLVINKLDMEGASHVAF